MAKHSQQELRDALSTAISMHEMPPSNRESAEKILSSAKYILEKVRRNLGEDLQAREYMYHRIEDLFYRTKKHVLLKVERVLQVADGIPSRKSSEFGPTKSCPISKSFILPLWSKSLVNTMSKTVSFGDIEPIGKTAQLIDPSIELKSVKSRTPTPASSFISLNAVVRETCTDRDVQIPVKTRENRYDLPHWSPNERIFVEHFYIKFKKAVLVGVERAVFDAIDLKKNEVQLSSRREILELDREYLINIMAESILTYNLNSYNYFGNTRLCISVLAAECLFDLQSTPLRAKYDSSYRVEPRCRCNIGSFGKTIPLKNSRSFK
ncbi:unnamed protein product [Hermetia illucens]|uniref:Uncharacterized protein n=1 Tax=Hermetia illucens TaxID=343691 RepID=A0A7R8UDR5_HERIL|nr:unnamed protein product [Hermetia illucens]